MTLTELVKKVKTVATKHILSLKSVIKGRGFEKFKKQYLFEEIIGTGGFGVVYSGFRLSTYQPVAIKFIERRQVIEWGKLDDERLPMEICMLSRCSRASGVIDLIEFFTVPDGFLIVLERPMVSIDLYGFITENGQLNETISRFLFQQIVDTTLDIMQNYKVIHRDIKNENIIIDLVTGRTKLIDFGAATYLKANKYHGFQGTRLYCPPEWFTHSLYLPHEATTWSLGIVCYSMLNGQLPFLNEKDICTKHLFGPLPKFTNYSDEAEDLIQLCLCYEPFRRIKLDKIRKHEWLAEKVICTWDTMLSDLLQKGQSTKTADVVRSMRKESGVNTSTQIEKPSRQHASIDDDQLGSRQNETVAIHSNRRTSLRNQANTCILQTQRQNRREQASAKFVRSKTSRIIPSKLLRNRAGSNDSGNQSCVQSCSQSPLTSPFFSSSTANKFIL